MASQSVCKALLTSAVGDLSYRKLLVLLPFILNALKEKSGIILPTHLTYLLILCLVKGRMVWKAYCNGQIAVFKK